MKRLVVLIIAVPILLISFPSFAQEVKVKEDKVKIKNGDAKMKMDVKALPYKAGYSSNFTIGNKAYANMILNVWKDWDENMLDRHDYYADSLEVFFADGTTLKGKQASIEAAKKFRSSMTSVKSTIHAWVPLKSMDMNEDVVCIWGNEENTMPDGKIENKEIHEVWWFNKDGKIHEMRQWAASVAK
jgi:hypothetical protein